MPRLALALVAVWFVSLFVLRTAIQWRRTGSTGVKILSTRAGSLPWTAGVTLTFGLAIAALAPVAALLAWPGGALLVSVPAIHAAGAVLAGAGIAGALAAQLSMGDSWRIGVDPSESTRLVTEGLFRWMRNPIFTFMLVSLAGFLLTVPNMFSLLALASTFAGIQLQVRGVEEPHLKQVHAAAYAAYAARVGRFLPGIGRLA